MNQYIKTIIVIGLVLSSIFGVFYFLGTKFFSDISPVVEISPINTDHVEDSIIIGKKSPSFDLVSITGNRIRSYENENKATIIFFWATWNTSSADQVRIFDDYINDNMKIDSELPVRIIAINSQETPSTATNFIHRGGYDVFTVFDPTGETGVAYGITSLPTTFFIDRKGVVVEKYIGVMNKKTIVDKVENIIK